MLQAQAPLLGGGLACLVACLAIVATQRWHGRFTMDGKHGVQKVHTSPTPRIGGLAMFVGLWVAVALVPAEVRALVLPMAWASIPAFAFGLIEDLTKRIGPTERLLATLVSGVLAWALTGISLQHIGVWGVDSLLRVLPISVAFTAFGIAGIANAMNIVDGLNGLASGIALISLSALGLIAYGAGDPLMAKACLSLAGIVLGFALVNFPWGKIFMGDGGAYLLGFVLGWLAVLVSVRNPTVSPWACLLACGHLILEVAFSMLRRIRRRQHPGHPDRLHLHSLIKSRFARKRFQGLPMVLRNSAASPFVWAVAAVPSSLAVVFAQSTPALLGSLAFSALVYRCIYCQLIAFARRHD